MRTAKLLPSHNLHHRMSWNVSKPRREVQDRDQFDHQSAGRASLKQRRHEHHKHLQQKRQSKKQDRNQQGGLRNPRFAQLLQFRRLQRLQFALLTYTAPTAGGRRRLPEGDEHLVLHRLYPPVTPMYKRHLHLLLRQLVSRPFEKHVRTG